MTLSNVWKVWGERRPDDLDGIKAVWFAFKMVSEGLSVQKARSGPRKINSPLYDVRVQNFQDGVLVRAELHCCLREGQRTYKDALQQSSNKDGFLLCQALVKV
jgi:hypothetical protein